MIIKSVTFQIFENQTLHLQHVGEFVITNTGETTVKVNGRTITPGLSISFMRGLFSESFTLEVEFMSEQNKQNQIELSYLVNDE